MNKFTALAATFLAATGATAASAQLAGPVTGTLGAAADATVNANVDPQPTIDRAQRATTRTVDTAKRTAEEAKKRADSVRETAKRKVDFAAEQAQQRVDQATDAEAAIDVGGSADAQVTAPGAEASLDADARAEADTRPER
ncbi:MAG: hypothetical protein AB3N06_04650 [Erythrobacter sp.]